MIKRHRSDAFDLDSPKLNKREKIILFSINNVLGLYLNFKPETYVKHCDLDKKEIRKHMLGFCSTVVNGKAQDPLITHLSKLLEPSDLANLYLVCKEKKLSC